MWARKSLLPIANAAASAVINYTHQLYYHRLSQDYSVRLTGPLTQILFSVHQDVRPLLTFDSQQALQPAYVEICVRGCRIRLIKRQLEAVFNPSELFTPLHPQRQNLILNPPNQPSPRVFILQPKRDHLHNDASSSTTRPRPRQPANCRLVQGRRTRDLGARTTTSTSLRCTRPSSASRRRSASGGTCRRRARSGALSAVRWPASATTWSSTTSTSTTARARPKGASWCAAAMTCTRPGGRSASPQARRRAGGTARPAARRTASTAQQHPTGPYSGSGFSASGVPQGVRNSVHGLCVSRSSWQQTVDEDDGHNSGTDDGGDEERNKQRPTSNLGDRPNGRFACPFFKRYPESEKLTKACYGPGWRTVHRVK